MNDIHTRLWGAFADCVPRSTFVDENKPQEIIIKPEILDLSTVKEGEGSGLFRPKSFNEYIGQQKAKERVDCYLKGCQKFNEQFPNTFLSSPAGCGKTVFANILANLLDKKFVVCTAGEIKSEQSVVDKIVECDSGIMFLDEAHRISNKVGTFLLPILEEYQINGKRIKPFTMIFSTTHKGNISQHLSALIQRFPLQIELENYSNLELVQIFKQYLVKQYKNEQVDNSILLEIAKNCRMTPRIGLSLLREYIYIRDWETVKANNNILFDGLTIRDVKILNYINNQNGASKMMLANFLRVEPKTYEFEIEPFLVHKELIVVANKRKLTNEGKQFLERIK